MLDDYTAYKLEIKFMFIKLLGTNKETMKCRTINQTQVSEFNNK